MISIYHFTARLCPTDKSASSIGLLRMYYLLFIEVI